MGQSRLDLLRLDKQLCFALHAASRVMTKTYREKLAKLHLTYPQYLVLLVLWERDGQTLNEICQSLMLDSGTMTPLVKRLEVSKHLVRKRRASDEREVEVWLTAKGKRVQQSAIGVREHVVCKLGMSEAQIGKLRSDLVSVIKGLDSNAAT